MGGQRLGADKVPYTLEPRIAPMRLFVMLACGNKTAWRFAWNMSFERSRSTFSRHRQLRLPPFSPRLDYLSYDKSLPKYGDARVALHLPTATYLPFTGTMECFLHNLKTVWYLGIIS